MQICCEEWNEFLHQHCCNASAGNLVIGLKSSLACKNLSSSLKCLSEPIMTWRLSEVRGRGNYKWADFITRWEGKCASAISYPQLPPLLQWFSILPQKNVQGKGSTVGADGFWSDGFSFLHTEIFHFSISIGTSGGIR